jgi:REP-associated tyrosine transposase
LPQPEGLGAKAVAMSQSHLRILVHLVFSAKNREPFIRAVHRERLFAYLGGTLKGIGCPPVIVGGMPDHVHLFFALARTLSISKVVEEVKKESSKWAKAVVHPAFYWQNGYGAFSVSPSVAPDVEAYIASQVEHHRRLTFQDEFRAALRKHGIEWDERYVWD